MKCNLSIHEEIFLNQFSQGIHDLYEMNCWFESYDLSKKKTILYHLVNMVIQAHPTYDDLKKSAEQLGKLKSTSAVMLLNPNAPFYKFGYKICDLPEKELLNGFNILLITLSKADNCRKAEEDPDQCHHWWHKDLSDPYYLRMIIAQRTERKIE